MSHSTPRRPRFWLGGRWLAVVLALALSSAAQADVTTTITFDAGDPINGLPIGATLGAQYAAFGVTFTANAFNGAGGPTGTWGTNTNMGIVSSTGSDVGGLGTPAGLVAGNVLRSFNGWLSEDGDPSFPATFSTPVKSFSAAFAGISTPSSTRIFAYNGTTLLSTVAATTTTGQQVLTYANSSTLITSVVITPGDFFDWVGVDNISFITPTTSAVPEPSPLVLAGVAGLPLALLAAWRRRRAR